MQFSFLVVHKKIRPLIKSVLGFMIHDICQNAVIFIATEDIISSSSHFFFIGMAYLFIYFSIRNDLELS